MNNGRLTALGVICGVLQIIGVIMIASQSYMSNSSWVLIGISGFAGVVKFFLPYKRDSVDSILTPLAALAGLVLVFIAVFSTA